jgi:hypothetical protein
LNSQQHKYRFSFTAASLQVPVMVLLAQKLVSEGLLLEELKADDLQKGRAKTNLREFIEIRMRLNTLSSEEISVLANSNSDEQKFICLISFGRTYKYFRDFIEEVVLEKISLFDFKISEMDYNVFFNKKSIDHIELEKLTTLTQNKIKQVIFKVMQQGGLIDNTKDRNIQIPQLSTAFENIIKNTNSNDLKLLLN